MTPSLAVTDTNMQLAEKKISDGEQEKGSSDCEGEKEARLFLTFSVYISKDF